MASFQSVDVAADTIDNICASLSLERVDLVSITTNGAEREILRGCRHLISKGVPYVCLALTGPGHEALMDELGYEFLSFDDRGATYRHRQASH